MALSNETVKVSYQGNDSDTVFAITFDVIVDDSAEVKVWIRDESVTPATETLQVETTNYTLTGASPPGTPFATDVTMNTAPASTEKLILVRGVPNTQTIDLSETAFPPETIELGFDRLSAQVQQHEEKLERCVKFSITEQETANPSLEDPEDDKFLKWSSGNLVNQALTTTDATLASQVEAEAGAENTKYMSALRTQQHLAANLKSVHGTQTITTTDSINNTVDTVFASSAGGAYTITLPAVANSTPPEIFIIKTTSDFSLITIDGNGSETINGSLTTTLATQYEALILVHDGSNWLIKERRIPSVETAYTAVATGFGTVATVETFWRRVGDSVEINGNFTSGTVTATEARIGLPVGLTSSTAKITSIRIAGVCALNSVDGGSNISTLFTLIEPTVIYVTFGFRNASFASLTKLDGDEIGASSIIHSIQARVPIVGWNG